jgi:tetratricopeptide (TPR) repeat protein
VDHNHPTLEELEGLMLGGISAKRAQAVILHLLRGCEACTQVLLPYVPARLLPEGCEAPAPPFRLEDYDAPIDRAFAALLGVRSSPDRTPEDIQRETVHFLTSGGLEGLADAPPELSGLPLLEALLERSWSLRHDNPIQMVQLAHAAALQATHLDEAEIGAQKAADLRCRAWTELANAYRVADELDCADQALREAVYFLHQGTCTDLLGARFFTVFASQQAARRRFDLAGGTLDIVASAYRRHGDHHLASRAAIMRSIFIGYSGNVEAAIQGIRQSLQSIDERREPALVFAALQSQIRFLMDSGKFSHALWALDSLMQRNLDVSGRINALKLRWLEGQIHVGLKELDVAEQALREVKQGFEEAGLGYKAALAGLELGSVWFQQGNFSDAEEIVLQCADVFLSLGIRRELTASLLIVRQAAESRYLSLTALETIIDQLHKEERSPRATPPEEV